MADKKDKAQQGKQDVLDQGGVGFTNEDAAGTAIQGQSAGDANRQSADPGQSAGASNGKAWRADVPDQSGVGFTAEDSGNAQGGSQKAGQNRQSSNAEEGESHNSRFLHSSPEANVFSKGSSQADNSSRSRGGDSAAGTPDEGRLGGSGGTSAPGTTGNDPDR